MKATDLIHGGYYLLGKDKEVVKFYALNGRFYTLDNRCIGQAYEDAESGQISCLVQCSVWMEVNPIPLTAEILEKNGFVQVEDGIQEYDFPEGIWQNDNLLCGLDYNYRGMFYTFSNNPEEDKLINQIYGIFYVHDLQRALRLCGLNELADNFMV